MKIRYKIGIIITCVFVGWILFPNIPGAICYFTNSGGISNDGSTIEPNICSITGINFFGHPLDTNLFDENVRAIISENFAEWQERK